MTTLHDRAAQALEASLPAASRSVGLYTTACRAQLTQWLAGEITLRAADVRRRAAYLEMVARDVAAGDVARSPSSARPIYTADEQQATRLQADPLGAGTVIGPRRGLSEPALVDLVEARAGAWCARSGAEVAHRST